MALGAADKAKKRAQENWRKKDREVDPFKRFGQLLRDSKKPSEAFAGAFPKDYATLLRAAQ